MRSLSVNRIRAGFFLYSAVWSTAYLNNRQRESAAKFLYDLAKGVLLITVVSPWVTGQASWTLIALGFIWAIGLFFWAYWLEGDRP